jgi:hypothetical protein
MTKEQFLSGTPFYVGRKRYNGDTTYSYNTKDNYILKQTRSSVDERIVLDDYECNLVKIGRLGFEGFTFILKKRVNVKYKFEDLMVFED